MAQTRIFRHERVDDIPLISGLANKLHLAEVLDRHMGTHGLQQGLNNGPLAVGMRNDLKSPPSARAGARRQSASSAP